MSARISFYQSKTRLAKGWKSWIVQTPAEYSPTGKKVYSYFSTEKEAKAYAQEVEELNRRVGTDALRAMGRADIEDYATAQAVLEGTGVTLRTAAQFVRAAVSEHGSLAMATQAMSWGAGHGEEEAPSVTVADCLAALQAAKNGRQRASTVESRNARFRRLFTRCKSLPARIMGHLTTPELLGILEQAYPHQPNSYNAARTELRALWNFAIMHGWVATNPLDRVPKLKIQETEKQAITPVQLLRLFLACRPPTATEHEEGTRLARTLYKARHPQATQEEKRLAKPGTEYQSRVLKADTSELVIPVALGAFAGIRPAEIARLTWGDISLEERVISLRPTHAKTGGTRHVNIHPTLIEWIRAYRSGNPDEPITPRGLKSKLTAMHRRAGFADNWPDDTLRHSFASYSIKAGASYASVAADMGHGDAQLIRTRYLNMRGVTQKGTAQYWRLTPQLVARARHLYRLQ